MIGSILKAGAKLVAREVTTTAAQNFGAKVGEALGVRVANRIAPPPPEKPEAKNPADGEPT